MTGAIRKLSSLAPVAVSASGSLWTDTRTSIASIEDLLDEAKCLIQRDLPLLTPERRQHGLE